VLSITEPNIAMGKEGVVVGVFQTSGSNAQDITTEIMSKSLNLIFQAELITSFHITLRLFWTHQSIK
jgi:hypothetical protein